MLITILRKNLAWEKRESRANIHAQFTYANLEEFFDEQGWLRRVKFNNDEFIVNQIVDNIPIKYEKEIHYQFN